MKDNTAEFELHAQGNPRIYEKDGEWFYEQSVADQPFKALLINLTLLYGKGNEPKTVEEFRKCFPVPAYCVKKTDLGFNDLRTVSKHDKVKLFNEKRRFTVRARNERYIILSKKCFNKALYTIVDLEEEQLGPDNLVFGIYDYCDEHDCEEALEALSKGDIEISVRRGISFNSYIMEYGR